MANNSPLLPACIRSRYDPERDELYRDFEEAVGGGAGPGEEQIDEDIAIEGGANQLAPNERCPITARPVGAGGEGHVRGAVQRRLLLGSHSSYEPCS